MQQHEWMEQIDERLARIEATLLGNGKPGLKTDVEILKRGQAITSRVAWIALGAIATSIAGMVLR